MNRRISTLVLILLLSLVSCSTWSAREWKDLQDRQFRFNRFTFANKMYNHDEAFAFMEGVPLRDIFDRLEETYCIRIDSSDYDAFINEKKKNELKESGFIIKDTYTWQAPGSSPNSVKLSYITHINSEGNYVRTYTLDLVSAGKIRKRFENDIDRDRDFVPRLLKSIASVTKVNPGAPLPEPLVKKEEPPKKDRIDEMLDSLSPEERDALKKKLEKNPE